MSSSTVHVKGISSQTSEKEVRDFFSFCGKIQSLSVTPESDETSSEKSATVTFEKETAAKTALLLDNTQLGPAQVHVTSAAGLDQMSTSGKTPATTDKDAEGNELPQEDKPRARIMAEYLAHGYTLSDTVVQRAIQVDQQHGISNRFTKALQDFDGKYKVSEKASQTDQKYGVSQRVNQGWMGMMSYFDQASQTPHGQKIRSFYEAGQKQVLDVHNEAKHLSNLKAGKGEQNAAGSSEKMPSAEEAEMEKVDIAGKERTKCNCGGADGKCPCEPGKCACSGCSKAGSQGLLAA